MNDLLPQVGGSYAIRKDQLNQILSALHKLGYQTVGPRVQDDMIVYAAVRTPEDLPRGFTSVQEAGRYRLVYTGHARYFDVTPGSQSLKQFLFPSRSTLFTARRAAGSKWQIDEPALPEPVYAFIAVRPCDLSAILVQDRVFLREEWSDTTYRLRRQSAFILNVNCLHPCGTCFCDSMGTGPKAEKGFDLSLTEMEDTFLAHVASEAGRLAVTGLDIQPASAFLLEAENRAMDEARKKMGRTLPDCEDLPELLLNNLEHPQWDDVAKRCLGCTNCTQACPTCFCWDAADQPNLSGDVTQRVRAWDSCFNPDYSYVAGGNTRPNTRSRYRQWLTHKVAGWKQQFGLLGCVGCGRCITWCPAAIDLTAEIAAIRKEKES